MTRADALLSWGLVAVTFLSIAAFVIRERLARFPLLDLHPVATPLISSGLAYKAAAFVTMASLSYLVTLQLQLAWGWSPVLAAVGTAPGRRPPCERTFRGSVRHPGGPRPCRVDERRLGSSRCRRVHHPRPVRMCLGRTWNWF